MTETLTNHVFDQLKIGDRAELTRTVTPDDIHAFAAVSGDNNPAHMDPDFAAKGPFGGIVAHGMWTAGLISALLGTRLPGPGTIYLGQQIQFRRPVMPGDTVTAMVEVAELFADKNRVRLATICTNQRGEKVLVGEASVIAPTEPVSWSPALMSGARQGRYQGFIDQARAAPMIAAGIVHPCSTAAILGAVEIRDEGLMQPILIVTDAAINIQPSLEHKRDICQNAVDLMRLLGAEQPKVAVLAAVETINPNMPATLDAAALTVMAARGQITGALVDGPLAFDNAISLESAETKGIASPVAGQADILLVPDVEAGNILAKQLIHFSGATAAGLVLGARVPIVLTSRADPLSARIASAALAKLAVMGKTEPIA